MLRKRKGDTEGEHTQEVRGERDRRVKEKDIHMWDGEAGVCLHTVET